MEDGFRLQEARIAIIGLGLMGGSLALALGGKCAALYGIDSNPATLELALAKKIVHEVDSHPSRLLPRADLVILATPVPAILDWLQRLPALTQNPCIVLDLGSTKKDIVRAMASLPGQFDPVGGHPICGREKLGIEHAGGDLFQGAPFVITPLERTTARAREAAKQIVAALEARWIEVDAEEHDRVLAFTSHMPFLLSSALVLSTPLQYSPWIGTGFRSTSRLAETPSSMTLGILESNRENILTAVSFFQQQLSAIQMLLDANDLHGLERTLDEARSTYQFMLSNP